MNENTALQLRTVGDLQIAELEPEVLADIMRDMDEGTFTLPKVTMSKDAEKFILPDDTMASTLRVVILAGYNRRACWESAGNDTEAGASPDCTSADCKIGSAERKTVDIDRENGNTHVFGNCNECDYSQFGSAIDDHGTPGPGQRCRLTRTLILWPWATPALSPYLLIATPASLNAGREKPVTMAETDTGAKSAAYGSPVKNMVTELYLEKRSGKGAITYLRLRARPVGGLSDGTVNAEQRAMLNDLGTTYKEMLGRAVTQQPTNGDPQNSTDETKPVTPVKVGGDDLPF